MRQTSGEQKRHCAAGTSVKRRSGLALPAAPYRIQGARGGARDQKVGRLDAAVDDPALVRSRQASRQLRGAVDCNRDLQRLVAQEGIEGLPSYSAIVMNGRVVTTRSCRRATRRCSSRIDRCRPVEQACREDETAPPRPEPRRVPRPTRAPRPGATRPRSLPGWFPKTAMQCGCSGRTPERLTREGHHRVYAGPL